MEQQEKKKVFLPKVLGKSRQKGEKKKTRPSRFFGQSNYLKDLAFTFIKNELSEHTQRAYFKDLEYFFLYMNARFELPVYIHKRPVFSSIKLVHIKHYHVFLIKKGNKGQGFSPQAILRKLAAISKFYIFLIREGIVKENPVLYVQRPKRFNLEETEAFTPEEVKRMLEAVDLTFKSGTLHYTILTLLFFTGIRRGELVKIRKKDYKRKKSFYTITVLGKGSKKREQSLHPFCSLAINRYLEKAQIMDIEIKEDDYLLRPLRSKTFREGLSEQFIWDIFRKYSLKAKIEKRVSPHSARATYITHHHENKIRIEDISEEVGHSDFNTTRSYVKRKRPLESSINFGIRYW